MRLSIASDLYVLCSFGGRVEGGRLDVPEKPHTKEEIKITNTSGRGILVLWLFLWRQGVLSGWKSNGVTPTSDLERRYRWSLDLVSVLLLLLLLLCSLCCYAAEHSTRRVQRKQGYC